MRNCLTCLMIITLFSTAAGSAEKEIPTLEWLELSAEATEMWKTEISAEDPGMMGISPKWEIREHDISKRIFMVLPKSSSSYSLAASVFLEVLHQEGIHARITLVNFNKDDTRGEEAVRLAESENADLIFSMGSESQTFFHKRENGRIPVVTCTSKDPVLLGFMKDYEQGSGTNIAYTSLNVPLNIQVNYLLALKPELRNIGLMYDKTHAEVMATEVIAARKKFGDLGMTVVDIAVEADKKKAAERLAELIPEAVTEMRKTDPELKNSIFWITSSTSVFSNIDVIKDYTDKIPVIGSIPNVVADGENSAVLAIGIDRRNNARLAGIYAVKILKGKAKAGDLKVGVVTPPDIAVNFLMARKIGLKIPFDFFESAAFIYDYEGKIVRAFGQNTGEKK